MQQPRPSILSLPRQPPIDSQKRKQKRQNISQLKTARHNERKPEQIPICPDSSEKGASCVGYNLDHIDDTQGGGAFLLVDDAADESVPGCYVDGREERFEEDDRHHEI